MLSIETRGDPFARGQQQGMATRELGISWLESRLADMAKSLGTRSVAEALARSRLNVESWRRQSEIVCPECVEECCGIAAGLGMDEPTYFAAMLALFLPYRSPQCSTCGFLTGNGQAILGKTDDVSEDGLGKMILERTSPSQGYGYAHFHCAGTIFTIAGMNEIGLAIAMTGIPGQSLKADGMPSLFALHTILPVCANVEEAVARIRDLRVNCYGFSLLIGDARGRMAMVEKTATGMAMLPAHESGCWFHTNHILDPELAARNPPQAEPLNTNGRRRLANAQRLMTSLPRSEDGMRALLRDRSPGGPISQHGEDGFYTGFAAMLLPARKKIAFWPGYPDAVQEQSMDIAAVNG